ncbi:UNKNOWN [Stylonychia lemnae]|uniref:Leucine rich repeat family protein n=1 Tax=Stylonychia lemnae TaxID=5949 RepID=A0A078B7J3_STYLE|nr:UNKNOWN [Stylonychia lemnae]|eukprot:CDW90470.1 UNKNOWN [Stylonychia lemnae]
MISSPKLMTSLKSSNNSMINSLFKLLAQSQMTTIKKKLKKSNFTEAKELVVSITKLQQYCHLGYSKNIDRSTHQSFGSIIVWILTQRMSISFRSPIMARFLLTQCGLGRNLKYSSRLNTLHLVKIKITEEAWTTIAEGLSKSKSLRVLQLNLMPISLKSLDQLADAVRSSQSIERIDLSMNDFSDEYGCIITKFVQSQQDMKDLLKWEGSLRGRPLDQSINENGLKELILHHNILGQKFLRSFGQRLKNDQYLRFVDLKFNQFEKEDIEELLECIKPNKSIFAIDLRNNNGYNSGKRLVKKHWIIKQLIFIELPEKRAQSGKSQTTIESGMQDMSTLQSHRLLNKTRDTHIESSPFLSPPSELRIEKSQHNTGKNSNKSLQYSSDKLKYQSMKNIRGSNYVIQQESYSINQSIPVSNKKKKNGKGSPSFQSEMNNHGEKQQQNYQIPEKKQDDNVSEKVKKSKQTKKRILSQDSNISNKIQTIENSSQSQQQHQKRPKSKVKGKTVKRRSSKQAPSKQIIISDAEKEAELERQALEYLRKKSTTEQDELANTEKKKRQKIKTDGQNRRQELQSLRNKQIFDI